MTIMTTIITINMILSLSQYVWYSKHDNDNNGPQQGMVLNKRLADLPF